MHIGESLSQKMLKFIELLGEQGHFVMQVDDGDAEERDGVVGAEDALGVDVDVEKFVEAFHVAHATMIRSAGDDAVEAGAAEGGTGRVQAEGTVAMLYRA